MYTQYKWKLKCTRLHLFQVKNSARRLRFRGFDIESAAAQAKGGGGGGGVGGGGSGVRLQEGVCAGGVCERERGSERGGGDAVTVAIRPGLRSDREEGGGSDESLVQYVEFDIYEGGGEGSGEGGGGGGVRVGVFRRGLKLGDPKLNPLLEISYRSGGTCVGGDGSVSDSAAELRCLCTRSFLNLHYVSFDI
jgi:hypothetical protein